ncbi:MAG: GTP-binding protein [Candidatus Colwellbacteria bacterium]|nr:GTP-binding protein [Candidatus Colwellbacteria bacterium]
MNDSNENPNALPRPPVVVVVGHVDHGKTSLLDYIRKTNVAGKEAGQITQSIGAYEVEHTVTNSTNAQGAPSVRKITFIDTPGHEAFTKMRSRGATIADLAILVVASDEGLKPQTEEAISILKSTKTPFVVAMTKIDKPSANIEKVKNELLTAGVLLEGYGGDVSYEPVSVVSEEGTSKLLDLISLLADVEGLTYDPAAKAHGFVLETHKDSRRGITASLILKDGTLREGEDIVTQTAFGKIKNLDNFLGQKVKELVPSAPASVLGFETAPEVGEEFWAGKVVLAEIKVPDKREEIAPVSDEEDKVSVILKADTAGSLEALKQIIGHLISLREGSVGEVTDGDIQKAISTKSIIIGFGVKVSKAAQGLARIHGVRVFTSEIIYELLKSLEDYVKGKEGPGISGELEVLKVFNNKEKRQIIGGKVLLGWIAKGLDGEIFRNEGVLGKGRVINLQENKNDVEEVAAGKECGILFQSDVRINPGDKLVFRS